MSISRVLLRALSIQMAFSFVYISVRLMRAPRTGLWVEERSQIRVLRTATFSVLGVS